MGGVMNLRDLKERAATYGATVDDDLARCQIVVKTDDATIWDRYLPLSPPHYSQKQRNAARRRAIVRLAARLPQLKLRGGLDT